MRAITLILLVAIIVFIGLAALGDASSPTEPKLKKLSQPRKLGASIRKLVKHYGPVFEQKAKNLNKKVKKGVSLLKKRKNHNNKIATTATAAVGSLADSSNFWLTPGKYTCSQLNVQNDLECTQRCINQYNGRQVHLKYWFAAFSDPPTCRICLKRICNCCAIPI